MSVPPDDVDLERDRTLVERFQQGDQRAFDTLYRRYFGRLKRFCLRRVGDGHVAEELAQEAFARALVALAELGGERRFYPWMTVIASRLCVDYHRQRVRVEPSTALEVAAHPEAGQRLEDAADEVALGAALARLSPRHREILDLREGRGWSYQRIAAHLDLSLAAVEALVFRARRALRREFLNTVDHGGGWPAVPGLAWAMGRVATLRQRFQPVEAGAAVALAPVLGLVLGASMLVAGNGDLPRNAVPPPLAGTTGPARVRLPTPSSAPAGEAPFLVASGAARRPPTRSSTTLAFAAGPLRGPVVVVDDDGTTRDRARRQPLHVELPGVATVGIDPDAIVGKITAATPVAPTGGP